MQNIRTSLHKIGEEVCAPEGFYFAESYYAGDGIVMVWKGCRTPPGLVRLCNLLVVEAGYEYTDPAEHLARLRRVADATQSELEANGLREPA